MKRKPTSKEWQKIKALYLKGEKPRFIVQKFPDLDITAKMISSKFSNNKTKQKREIIKERVEKKLIDDIIKEQEKANKELIKISSKIVDVVKNYLENGQYNDFAGFTKSGFFCESSETLNTRGFSEVVKALANAQKVQRLALGMDEKEEKEDLTTPIINIDFGGGENE
jgi:transcriptional regulator of heat shock response